MRILIRSGKLPWQPISPEATLAGNVLGTNAGNMLFSTAVFSALSSPDNTLSSDYFQIERSRDPKTLNKVIDDSFDAIVLPLANAFRPSWVKYMNRWTDLLERTTIPAVVVGVGGQFSYDSTSPRASAEVEEATKRFVRTVLTRTASIGVRGQMTFDYLRGLGFPEDTIDVIGCPSLFRPDIDLNVQKGAAELNSDARVALVVTPAMAARELNDKMGKIVRHNSDRYANLLYVPQENRDLEHFLWGTPYGTQHSDGMPLSAEHPLFASGRAAMFVDSRTWTDTLRSYQFAFGNRIHGNIAALLAGVPAMVLAFDSRLRELAEFHAIPQVALKDVAADVSAAELYARADNDLFNKQHALNTTNYCDFLAKNHLDHNFAPAAEDSAFTTLMAQAHFPGAVTPMLNEGVSAAVLQRLNWLRQESREQRSVAELRALLPEWTPQQRVNVRNTNVGAMVDKLEREAVKTRRELALVKRTLDERSATGRSGGTGRFPLVARLRRLAGRVVRRLRRSRGRVR